MGVQVIVLVEEAEEVMASLPRIFRSRKKSRALRNNFITGEVLHTDNYRSSLYS